MSTGVSKVRSPQDLASRLETRSSKSLQTQHCLCLFDGIIHGDTNLDLPTPGGSNNNRKAPSQGLNNGQLGGGGGCFVVKTLNPCPNYQTEPSSKKSTNLF